MLRTVCDAIPTQQALGNFSSSGTFICPLEENMLLLVTSTQKQIRTQAATKFMNSSDKCFIMARKCLTPTVLYSKEECFPQAWNSKFQSLPICIFKFYCHKNKYLWKWHIPCRPTKYIKHKTLTGHNLISTSPTQKIWTLVLQHRVNIKISKEYFTILKCTDKINDLEQSINKL